MMFECYIYVYYFKFVICFKMVYPLNERIFLHEKYMKLKNYSKVSRAYKIEFKKRCGPNPDTVKRIVQSYKQTGSVSIKTNRSRPNLIRTEELVKSIDKLYLDDRQLSLRKAEQLVPASKETIRKVLREDLNKKPYKKKRTFLLYKSDHEKRLNFVKWVTDCGMDIVSDFICSDEAIFYLHGGHNIQNDRIWAEFQPNELVESPLNDDKIMIWCAFSSTHVWGPYYFEETVKWTNYLSMIQNYFWRSFCHLKDKQRYYFQQDGAPPHRKKEVQTWLKEHFGDKFIEEKTWPPRSPDLNPCDFSLWGNLKHRVYNPKPTSIQQLKENIEREIKNFFKSDLRVHFEN